MAADIGPSIGVKGKSQFEKQMKDINASVKALGSEMKVVQARFEGQEKSEEALIAKSSVLQKSIEAETKKIEVLKQELAQSSERFGENSAETQKFQDQLNKSTAKLYSLQHQLDDTEKSLSGEADSAEEAGEETEEAGDKAEKSEKGWSTLNKTVLAVGAAMGAAVLAAGKVAVELGKSVVNAVGDYEQLAGGVETLFGDSADTVEEYANKAFKTAGLSANEYMETVTGFSASLLQSLDGDTEKAAKLADQAIIDMSDNANKMGTDIESIQNAYQGFAKGQYTLLDNLKLGYGGTKTEMERLLADAEAISGVHYDISSYADIVSAIHVVQEEMGIAGTTAKEASSTIQGSIASMGSAWQNLLSGLGNSETDIEELTGLLVESFQNVLANITPVVENLIQALPTAISALVDAALGQLPLLLDTATTLFSQVLNQLLTLLPELIPMAVDAILTITDTLIANLPLLIDSAIAIILALVQGLTDALPDLIPTAVSALLTIVDSLMSNLDMLVECAIELMIALSEGLISALPELISRVPEILVKLVSALIENAPKLLSASLEMIKTLGQGLVDSFPLMVEKGKELIEQIKEGFHEKVEEAKTWGKDLIDNFISGITQKWEDLKSSVSGIAQTVKDFLGFSEPKYGPLSNFHTYAPDMVDLFISGLERGQERIATAMNNVLTPAVGAVGGVPSTVSLDSSSLSAINGRSGETVVNVNFTGSLAQLGRLLQPEIQTATVLAGDSLIN